MEPVHADTLAGMAPAVGLLVDMRFFLATDHDRSVSRHRAALLLIGCVGVATKTDKKDGMAGHESKQALSTR